LESFFIIMLIVDRLIGLNFKYIMQTKSRFTHNKMRNDVKSLRDQNPSIFIVGNFLDSSIF